jgi:hypothetical protein
MRLNIPQRPTYPQVRPPLPAGERSPQADEVGPGG